MREGGDKEECKWRWKDKRIHSDVGKGRKDRENGGGRDKNGEESKRYGECREGERMEG